MRLIIYSGLCCLLLLGCQKDDAIVEEEQTATVMPTALPFTKASFDNLDLFADPTANWQIAGGVFVDRTQDNALEINEGSSILVNQPTSDTNSDLYTAFEHSDIELELEVMMPKGSNSGIYLQSRYEVQLLDSWGKKEVGAGDMGGIYERWDDSKADGQKGYEGYAPKMNAAKAPGLWQSLKIVFHAPRFDATGQKTKNAQFKEIRLNGVLIHENVSLSGPTRGPTSEEEVALAPLRIQGDHGAVAFRNMRYKLYDGENVKLNNMTVKEYESETDGIPDISTLKLKTENSTDSISYEAASTRDKFALVYEGDLVVPNAGEYLFKLNVNVADVLFVVNNDTLFLIEDDLEIEHTQIRTVDLAVGANSFILIYNKSRRWWKRGLKLSVEGPGIELHPLHSPSSAFIGAVPEPILISKEDEAVLQRGFLMHNGAKLTHAISVGTPEGIHYSFDLAMGALLQVWGGDFLDVTDMWHERGEKQLSVPIGAVVDFHGQPSIARLASDNAAWPDSLQATDFRPLGYEIDNEGNPNFMHESYGTTVSHQLFPSSTERRVTRQVSLEGNEALWLKIDEGVTIEQLKDGSYAVNDYEYFIEMEDRLKDKAVIRHSKNKTELLLKLDAETRTAAYDIIW
ncbi:MAG: DUF1080 domain-containing protein [Bacteroidota bacterium]